MARVAIVGVGAIGGVTAALLQRACGHQRGVMDLKVPDDSLGRSFVNLFAGSPADATTVPDFKSVVWRKLCFNSAGVLSALVMQRAGVVRGEALGDVALQIIRECAAVARAEGATLEDN